MPRILNHIPLFFLTLTALTGVWMRLFAFSNHVQALPYDHILHAHSHIAILGWTFLAVLLIYFKMTWEHLENKKQAIALVITTFIITFLMFVAFLWQGYALFSIIFSTLHLLIEYWAIIFILRSFKTVPDLPIWSKRFFNGALLTLFVSSIGPWSLGAIASQGLKESALFDMAIYFYLHFQYNGWLYLFLVGLFLFILAKKGIRINSTLVTASFWTTIIALFPGYFLSVLWYNFGLIGVMFAWVGAIGQLIGVFLLCLTLFKAEIFASQKNILLHLVFLLLISKTIMELGLLHIPFGQLIYETRAVVIGYLHLTLLGFISLFIFTQYQMVGLLEPTRKRYIYGLFVFLIGFGLNELTLFLSGLFDWMNGNSLPLQNEFLILASILLLIGVLFVWCSTIKQQVAETKHSFLKAESKL